MGKPTKIFSPKKGFIGFVPFHANKENKTGNFLTWGLFYKTFIVPTNIFALVS
jgi:hypothetical protein